MDDLLTVGELAKWLKVLSSWIYRAARTDSAFGVMLFGWQGQMAP